MKRTIWLIFIFLTAQWIASFIVVFFLNYPSLSQEERLDVAVLASSPSALGLTLLLSGGLVWLTMLFLRWTDCRGFHSYGIGYTVYFIVILWMLPIIFIVNLLSELLVLEDLRQDTFVGMAYNQWGVLAIVLVGPFTEELVFRMGIQRHLVHSGVRPKIAIFLSALVFGAVHANPAQIPGAVVIGVVLGWLYWKSDTIWLPVAAHAFNNLVGVGIMWCVKDESATLVGLCGSLYNVVFCCFLSIVSGGLGFYYLNNKLSVKSRTTEKEKESAVTRF
ncbi:type II CAAX endopeptidase family protein [Bacteroides acidifaciens]|uniref:CPBP family intramembrane glutamic endopeptidase n=2 Tax=Bacteroides acidifaciens TaxID=85831 RepID=UPI003013EC79